MDYRSKIALAVIGYCLLLSVAYLSLTKQCSTDTECGCTVDCLESE